MRASIPSSGGRVLLSHAGMKTHTQPPTYFTDNGAKSASPAYSKNIGILQDKYSGVYKYCLFMARRIVSEHVQWVSSYL